jgi:hypothetical protein
MKKEELIKKLEGIKEISPVVSIESMISLIQGLEAPSQIQDETITVDLATSIADKIEGFITRAGRDMVDLDSANFEIGYDNRIELTDVEIDLSNVMEAVTEALDRFVKEEDDIVELERGEE